MTSNDSPGDLGSGDLPTDISNPDAKLAEKTGLLQALLNHLGWTLEEAPSRLAAERAEIAGLSSFALNAPGDSYNALSTSTTATHSLSGNDSSSRQSDVDDNESWHQCLNDEPGCLEGNHDKTCIDPNCNPDSWSAQRAPDVSIVSSNTNDQSQEWLPIVNDLLTASTPVVHEWHDGAQPLDSDPFRSTASQVSQRQPTILLETPSDETELQQQHTLYTPLNNPANEQFLPYIGGVHQDYSGYYPPPSRLETPNSDRNSRSLNRRPYTTVSTSPHSSPVDEGLPAVRLGVVYPIPPWVTDSNTGGSRKRSRLDSPTETSELSTALDTPALSADIQDLVTLPIPARSAKACVRCRFQHLRCLPDPQDPNGPCLKCKELKRSTWYIKHCWPTILADAHLYREQIAPNPFHTLRWAPMTLENMDTWASDEIKTIAVGHVKMNQFYNLRVRKYIPQLGDMVDERWVKDGRLIYHPIPPYAIADMEEATKGLGDYLSTNTSAYIKAFVDRRHPLFWYTYMMALKHQTTAATTEERDLIKNVLRLWVYCRKISNPECICGDERLGVEVIHDENSPWYNTAPIPPILIAQMQCIMYTRFLRPLRKQVLDGLSNVLKKARESYLTVYLTMFILLHSCSMITRRNREYAEASGLAAQYANPRAILDHQEGCNILLNHFHYINKTASPFHLDPNSPAFRKFAEAASLNEEQEKFIVMTSIMVQQNKTFMLQKRERREFWHDLYWVSQLYETTWARGPTINIS